MDELRAMPSPRSDRLYSLLARLRFDEANVDEKLAFIYLTKRSGWSEIYTLANQRVIAENGTIGQASWMFEEAGLGLLDLSKLSLTDGAETTEIDDLADAIQKLSATDLKPTKSAGQEFSLSFELVDAQEPPYASFGFLVRSEAVLERLGSDMRREFVEPPPGAHRGQLFAEEYRSEPLAGPLRRPSTHPSRLLPYEEDPSKRTRDTGNEDEDD
ncbi:hypothetical protein AMS68_000731 [Peltaster fructicola]|uniref:Uncharacterized protein n=1 Tax=Peltaster fructicola TaxID=286661 RepID=A0A6H0XKF5_9PEZI|nr:hypothetical protein AMS68_000731 [Peltaster fructicola]